MKPLDGMHVICALAGEARTLAGSGATVTVCGIGPGRARAAAERALTGRTRAVVSWGTAGGLAPDLPTGHLLVPALVRDGAGGQWSTAPLTQARGGRLARTGALLSVPILASSPDTKARLWRVSRCDAVDMESAAIAAACAARGVPVLVVRAIADPSHQALPPWLLDLVNEQGRPRPGALIAALAHRPQRLEALLACLATYHRALRALRLAAARLPGLAEAAA